MVYKFLDKKSSGSGADAFLRNKSASEPNYQLENELHKLIIGRFKKKRFIHCLDTIFGVPIHNHEGNTTKESGIYCVQLICLVNMRGFFL